MRESMTRLILIRHGETEWTRAHRYQGDTNTPLSTKGKNDVKAVARVMGRTRMDFLYSSALVRARESAAIIAPAVRKKPVPDSRLNEINFGNWEGKTAAQLWKQKDAAFRRWCRGQWISPTGGEKISDFRKRVSRSLYGILRRHRGKTVAVVAHGGTIKMIIMEALKLSSRSLWMMRVDPASISLLNFFSGFNQLALLNFVPAISKRYQVPFATLVPDKKGREAWR